MKAIVFYSWQSDLPNRTNRGFIHEALERAVKEIHRDESIEVEPVVDRDTYGVAGSPDIAGTIFSKIGAADVFVPDISLITAPEAGRQSPNPNVLLELGFAIKALGWERIVMVINTSYGEPSSLPFDLRGRRVIPYALGAADTDKAAQRKQLADRLTEALRGVFEHRLRGPGSVTIEPPSMYDASERAVESQAANRVAVVRRFVNNLDGRIEAIAPDLTGPNPSFDSLATALDAVTPLVAEFGRIAKRAAEMDDRQVLGELYQSLEFFAERYSFRGSGTWYEHQFEFWRFVGRELIVMLVACMIQEDHWETLTEVLNLDLIVENTNRGRQSVGFSFLRQGLALCGTEAQQRSRLSVAADILKSRHSADPLREIVDFETFMEADYFLFLRTELSPQHPNSLPEWIPESAVFLKQPPRYLLKAQRIQVARRIAAAVGVDRPETLRDRLLDRHGLFGRVFPRASWPPNPFEDDMNVIHKLGSR